MWRESNAWNPTSEETETSPPLKFTDQETPNTDNGYNPEQTIGSESFHCHSDDYVQAVPIYGPVPRTDLTSI